MVKLISKKQLIIIAGILGLISLVIFFSGGDNKNNQIIEQKNQPTQASLKQSIENIIPEKGAKKENDYVLDLRQNGQSTETREKQELLFRVIKVIDGDTIKLENGEVVRYLGIDTPETVHPSEPVQCFGQEASDKNKELVEGKLVKLEKDVTDRDKYNRLLRYVWVNDIFVNDYLVRQGYAYVYTYPPDVKYAEQFIQAQQEAKENNRGFWMSCLEQAGVEEAPASVTTPPREGIICSYNAYNCSDFSTHAEAQSIFEYCGGKTNDIHRLDTDKDGLACESLP